MTNFRFFLKDLLENLSNETVLLINGQRKVIKAMARYTTINYRGDEYIKIVFRDHSFMLILLKEKEIYFADEILGKAIGITDQMIGRKTIEYKGNRYQLVNKNDYQFCLQLYIGKPLDIEGECRFSDYAPLDGTKEFLSLGWLTYNGKRADINPHIIDLSKVEIVKK